MASARTEQLKVQRAKSAVLLKFGKGTRVLSTGTKTNSIAANVQAAEDKDITNRYADGQISNEAYMEYLNSILKRSGLTYKDRVQVENTIRDTSVKIGAEQMEANYDMQEPNSDCKAQAAEQVGNYWKQQADSLVPGTPAHSNAMQKYGDWSNKAQANALSAGRTSRAMARAQKEYEISAMDLSKSDGAMEASNMYMQLAQEAAQDGDQLQASQFATKSNNLIETANTAAAAEQRKEVLLYMADIKNQWHDGSITYEQALQALNQVETYAIENGDATVQNSVNSLTDRIYKDNEKGINRTTAGGLAVVTGRGAGSGSSSLVNPGTNKTWEEEDEDYTNQMMDIDWKIKTGQINAEDGRGQQYILMMERTSQLDSRLTQLGSVPWGSKVPYQGDNVDAGDLRKEFQIEFAGDASKPFLTKGLTPEFLKNNGIQTLVSNSVGQLIVAKYDSLVESGTDISNMSVQDIYDQMDLDLQGKTGVAYIRYYDENNQPQYKVLSTQNNPKFIPGSTHLYDGLAWHEIQKDSKEFSTEEQAKSYYQSIFGIAPGKDEMEQLDNGWWKVITPEYANIDGLVWRRSEGGGWGISDPELDKQFNSIMGNNVEGNPINAENKSYTVLSFDKLNALKQNVTSARNRSEIERINQRETTDPYERNLTIAGENAKQFLGDPTGAYVTPGMRPTDQFGRELSLREQYTLKNPPLENVGQNILDKTANTNPALRDIIKLPEVPGKGQSQSYQSPLGLEQRPSNEFVNSIIQEGKDYIKNPVAPVQLPSNLSFNQPSSIAGFQPSNVSQIPNLPSVNTQKNGPINLSNLNLGKINLSGLQNNGFTSGTQLNPSVQQQVQKPSILENIGQKLQPTLSKIKNTVKGWFS